MKNIISILFILISPHVYAQELFTWSEPASNMAAKGFGFRVTNTFMNENSSGKYQFQALPEIMWGISGKLMIHVQSFLNNINDDFTAKGGALYLKYRFFSEDEVHSHFRMAVFAKAATNNGYIDHASIDLNGHNSGVEAGIVATKLINKMAFSAGGSLVHAFDNINNPFYGDDNRNALDFNLSFGKLMLPKEYTGYKQVNMNLMLELLGQTNFGSGKSYVDLAPAIQFILLSKMRIDGGYRFAMIKDIPGPSSNEFLLRLEYNIFNAYK